MYMYIYIDTKIYLYTYTCTYIYMFMTRDLLVDTTHTCVGWLIHVCDSKQNVTHDTFIRVLWRVDVLMFICVTWYMCDMVRSHVWLMTSCERSYVCDTLMCWCVFYDTLMCRCVLHDALVYWCICVLWCVDVSIFLGATWYFDIYIYRYIHVYI